MDCNSHGTHVSGIIASDDNTFGGVAPDVTLRAYKVFGCGGSTFEDVIIAAFLKAHEDGADIISASLGSNRGFPDAPLSTVSAAIQAEGTFVSIAAGNAGSSGLFLTSSGGNGVGVTTVGSVQRDDFPGYTVLAQSSGGETREIVSY
jgi:subtilisin family serine protease